MTFQDVETARQIYAEKFKKGLTVTIILTVLACASVILVGPILGVMLVIIVLGVSAIFTSFATGKDRTAYRKAYKGYFVEQNLKKIFTNVDYAHDRGFTPNIVAESEMIRLAEKFYSNDLTLAKYKNINFAQADVAIIHEYTDDQGNTHEYPVFKGRYMMFEFPKKFDFRLEVVGRKFKLYRVPGKDRVKNRKMTRLETESTEFNHNFKIFGQDGFESFYLLDPAIIERINNIAKLYDYKLLLGFYDNKLIVALNDGKDSFEPARFTKPIDEPAEMQKVAGEIKVITDFVDVISSH